MSMRTRWWLFAAVIAALTLTVTAVVLEQRRGAAQHILTEATQREFAAAEHALAERTHVAASLLAESLVNPTYFFDLQRIGEVLVGSLKRDDVAYVMLLDHAGRILHDGSANIARYGQLPDDALASAAIAATAPTTLSAERFVEVAFPILLGDQRLATLRLALVRKPDPTAAPVTQQPTARMHDLLLLGAMLAAF